MTTPNTPPRIWVLLDDRAGHASQALGVAEKMGLAFEPRVFEYNPLAKLPNALLGATLMTLSPGARAQFCPPWPDIVIAAGRRTAPAALYLKKKNPHCRLVQLMHPGAYASRFDFIITPTHDDIHASNVLSMPLSPHRLTTEKLEEARLTWQAKLAHLKPPYVAVLLGGVTHGHRMTKAQCEMLGRNASALAKGGSLLITTSRRTAPEELDALHAAVTVPHYTYRFGAEDNPYLGFLALASALVVTGDSMSMVSEACFTGKPVYVYAPSGSVSKKHARMHEALYKAGVAAPLMENAQPFHALATPPDTARHIAAAIRERWIT